MAHDQGAVGSVGGTREGGRNGIDGATQATPQHDAPQDVPQNLPDHPWRLGEPPWQSDPESPPPNTHHTLFWTHLTHRFTPSSRNQKKKKTSHTHLPAGKKGNSSSNKPPASFFAVGIKSTRPKKDKKQQKKEKQNTHTKKHNHEPNDMNETIWIWIFPARGSPPPPPSAAATDDSTRQKLAPLDAGNDANAKKKTGNSNLRFLSLFLPHISAHPKTTPISTLNGNGRGHRYDIAAKFFPLFSQLQLQLLGQGSLQPSVS